MSDHTPGPWEYAKGADGELRIYAPIFPGATRAMVDIADVWTPAGEGNVHANGQLMATSPELLSVVKSMEIKGPDSDGQMWLTIVSPKGPSASFNLGRPEPQRLMAETALEFEKNRRNVVRKAESRDIKSIPEKTENSVKQLEAKVADLNRFIREKFRDNRLSVDLEVVDCDVVNGIKDTRVMVRHIFQVIK